MSRCKIRMSKKGVGRGKNGGKFGRVRRCRCANTAGRTQDGRPDWYDSVQTAKKRPSAAEYHMRYYEAGRHPLVALAKHAQIASPVTHAASSSNQEVLAGSRRRHWRDDVSMLEGGEFLTVEQIIQDHLSHVGHGRGVTFEPPWAVFATSEGLCSGLSPPSRSHQNPDSPAVWSGASRTQRRGMGSRPKPHHPQIAQTTPSVALLVPTVAKPHERSESKGLSEPSTDSADDADNWLGTSPQNGDCTGLRPRPVRLAGHSERAKRVEESLRLAQGRPRGRGPSPF